MRELERMLRFLWPYWRPYKGRLLAGILFGVGFGLFNGLLLGVLQILSQRLVPGAEPIAVPVIHVPQGMFHGVLAACGEFITQYILIPCIGLANHWLPQIGMEISWKQIVGGLLILPILAGTRGLLSYLSSYCISWVGEHVTNDLRVTVMRKLTFLSLDYFDRSKMGDMLTRVQGDTAAIQNGLDRGVSDGVKEPFTILGVFVGLLLIDWKLTAVALFLVPLCIVPVRILGKKVRRATQAGIGQSISQSSLLVESLGGIRVIKAFTLEKSQIARFIGHSRELMRMNIKRVQARQLVNPVIEIISMLGIGLLLVYVVIAHPPLVQIPPFLFGLIVFQNSFKKLATIHIVYKEASVAIGRLSDVIQLNPTVRERSDAVALPPFHEALVLRGVRFGYGEHEILRGIDLSIPRGVRLGIAGESGSGKSTLLNLLLRFYDPTAGAILFDGIDLREAALSDLRSQIALVSQDAVLFDMTVAENIACGRLGATQAEVEEAARAAFAHDFILRMPQGYETLIGERGIRLSGGQRARLAIARAFIRNAPILILDEPTAALDAEAEKEVQRALDRLAEHRTVICVAHRLATLQPMDRIIVLSRGEIVEQGSFNELVQRDGLFSRMASQQGLRAVESRAI